MLRDGELQALADADLGLGSPRVNNNASVVWSERLSLCSLTQLPPVDSIHYHDGIAAREIFNDGLSNQIPVINNDDEIIWTRFDFSCPFSVFWPSDILLFADGEIASRVLGVLQAQLPAFNDHGREGWDGHDNVNIFVEVVEDGVSRLMPARSCCLDMNNLRDVFFNWHTSEAPWQVVLDRDGVQYRISKDVDIADIMDNGRPVVNDLGEIVWWWSPNGAFSRSGIRYMRRVRNGDVNFDGVVDLADFIPFPGCFTGPVPTDGLCDCRFFDIDHDRDIDRDDFELFMRVYGGPLEDCNDNGTLDLDELVDGTSFDCNLNGRPDGCDLADDPTLDIDGDGMIDECCPGTIEYPRSPPPW